MHVLQSLNFALLAAIEDPSVLICSQLGKYGLGGLTIGLYEKRPAQVLTYPVCENFMNGSAMGLSLAGMRPVVIHERMDFLAVGMDPLVNHIPIWPKRQPVHLPLVIIAVVGKGKGQGPQHSKNLTHWFRSFEGWTVAEPQSPQQAHDDLLASIFGDKPVLYVVHREFFSFTQPYQIPAPESVGLCGASAAFEADFYG